jgi:hypothetical protein
VARVAVSRSCARAFDLGRAERKNGAKQDAARPKPYPDQIPHSRFVGAPLGAAKTQLGYSPAEGRDLPSLVRAIGGWAAAFRQQESAVNDPCGGLRQMDLSKNALCGWLRLLGWEIETSSDRDGVFAVARRFKNGDVQIAAATAEHATRLPAAIFEAVYGGYLVDVEYAAA